MTETRPPAPTPPDPAWRSVRAICLFVGLTLAMLAIDLGVKSWSFSTVAGVPVEHIEQSAIDHADFWQFYAHEPTVVVPSILNLRLTTNTGAVFGLGKGSQWVFATVSILATAFIIYMFVQSRGNARWLHAALAFILSGALGNLYDRLMYRAVRDMFHLFPGVRLPFGWEWSPGVDEVYPWIFNIADASLIVGVAIMMIIMWRSDTRPQNAESAPR